MRHNIIGILLVSVMVLAGAEQSLRQFQSLKCIVENWAQSGLWSCMQSVHAEGRPRAARVAAVVGSNTAASQDNFQWQGQVATGNAIEIKGVNGDIRAEAASGNQVEVVATKSSRRSDPNSVRIQVVEHNGGVTICAVYPSSDSRPNVCAPGDEGQMNVRNNDVSVDFIVRVPSSVRFQGRTVNGEVAAESLGSDVEASTVNGSINLSTAGYARASTVNGEINASMGRANWTQPLEFETVNGGITVSLPAGASTEFEAETLNGDISTDFQVTVQGRFSKRHMSGTIGDGGRRLSLKTVNGSIRVRRTS